MMEAAVVGSEHRPDTVSPEAVARLAQFKTSLEQSFPGSVAAVILFGSRARGDARDDSDYDLAILLRHGLHRQGTARDIVSDHAFDHIVNGYAFMTVVLPEDYLQPVSGCYRTELARRIAGDGLYLS